MKYEITVKENGKKLGSFDTDKFFLIVDQKEKVATSIELHDAEITDIISMIEATREMINKLLEEKPDVAFCMALCEALKTKGANNED